MALLNHTTVLLPLRPPPLKVIGDGEVSRLVERVVGRHAVRRSNRSGDGFHQELSFVRRRNAHASRRQQRRICFVGGCAANPNVFSQISGGRCFTKLSVKPCMNSGGLCSSLGQVVPKVGTQTEPEERGQATHRRRPVLIHIVQHVVGTTQDVFDFGGGESSPRRSNATERPSNKQSAVSKLTPGEHGADGTVDGLGKRFGSVAGQPSTRSVVGQPEEERGRHRKTDVVNSLALRFCESSTVRFEPNVENEANILGLQRGHLEQVVRPQCAAEVLQCLVG
mmetsp:Transcript_60541/g.131382  ORF Transcript_60541/g.131382 Transcript_60541/m.131382 type:complete len:280 (+) Transcript_60541:1342-2181(+)